uniref:Heparanase n=1 Tax=Lygus hesperus TaxID=30085 RepID=A0A0A9YNK1_LYGHE
MDWKWVLLLPHILSFYITLGSEVIVQVNTKKWIYYVPERFLSLTVDPLTLAAASPLTQESYNMAKGLSPSFVRIGGIGTNALIFGKEFMVNSSTVSESQWDSVNDFARGTGLDIIASLNPSIQVQGVWDSQNSLELISYSNKKRHSVAWQLGYDVRGYNASGAEIGRDLVRLAKILDGFPKYAGSPVFGPDISSVSGAKQIHFVKDLLTNAGNSLGSIILQPKFMNDGEPEDPYDLIASMTSELDTYVWNKEVRVGKAVPKKPVWIAEPTASKGSFSDAVKFVKRIGAAARMGTQIYMRQAGAVSLKSPTPEFWFSLLYKNLVGQGVLDNKIISQNQSDVHMFAHCTASVPQEKSVLDSDWNYEKGAVTLFGVNESPSPVKLVLKVTSKEEPLHIYVLTSGEKNARGQNPTLLNGQELMLSPTWDLPVLSPKVKRPSKSASVTLPGESIFFVVMPDSKIRTCSVPPLVTPDLNLSELSKRLRLGPPKKAETLEEEQEIEPSEDLMSEGVYVTFVKKKRHDVEAKNNNNARLDNIGKSLMQTIISKLAPKKIEVKTSKPVNEEEMPVYITFNENSFLNKLAEGVKEELKGEDQLEFDAKKDKYAPITAAMTNARLEESSAKSESVSVEPDVIKIEPVVETSNIPDTEPEKSVSRMRRSSNEDPLPGSSSPKGEKPLKIEVTTNEPKKTNAAVKEDVGGGTHNLENVSAIPDVDPGKMDDKTRSARHIGDGTEEESDDLNAQQSSDDAKKVVVEEVMSGKEKDFDDAEDIKNKTLALVKIVQETEKVENISESPESVMVPPEASEQKLEEIMMETAKSKSEPEPDSDNAPKEARSSSDVVDVSKDKIPPSSATVEPPVESGLSLSSGYSRVSGLAQLGAPNSGSDTSQIQLITEQQPKVPVVTNGNPPQGQQSPGSQVVNNPIIVVPQPQQQQQQMVPISSQTRDNHIIKIPLPTPPNNNQPHGIFSVQSVGNPAPPFYNEQKEMAINNILSKIVNEEDSKPSLVSPNHDVKPGVTEGGQLVAVPLPGNDAILMAPEDVKILNHQEASEGVKTLENGDPPIELPNGEDVPKMVLPRQVSTPEDPEDFRHACVPNCNSVGSCRTDRDVHSCRPSFAIQVVVGFKKLVENQSNPRTSEGTVSRRAA